MHEAEGHLPGIVHQRPVFPRLVRKREKRGQGQNQEGRDEDHLGEVEGSLFRDAFRPPPPGAPVPTREGRGSPPVLSRGEHPPPHTRYTRRSSTNHLHKLLPLDLFDRIVAVRAIHGGKERLSRKRVTFTIWPKCVEEGEKDIALGGHHQH